MKALFRDGNRRKWYLDVDEHAIERLKWIGFVPPTLADMATAEGRERVAAELEELFHDAERIIDVAWQLVLPRAQQVGVRRAVFETAGFESLGEMRQELFAALSLYAFNDRFGTLIMDHHDGLFDEEFISGR